MTLSEYLKSQPRGAGVSLAKTIGAHVPDLSRWADGSRPVPIHHCYQIEVATSGAVTRRDLRPDDWKRIWPELSDAA